MQPGKNVMSIRLGGGVGFNRYMYITQFNGNVNSARGLRVFVAVGGMPHSCGGIWQDEDGTRWIPTLYVSSYVGVFLLCYHKDW